MILTFGLFILIKISMLVLYKSYSNIKILSIFKENYVSDNSNIINEVDTSKIVEIGNDKKFNEA